MFPSPFRRRASVIRASAMAATMLMAGVAAQAQAVLSPPSRTVQPQNALAIAAANVGLAACRPALERFSAIAINGARSNDVLVDWDRKRPANSPVFALVGLEYPDGGAAMSISTAPGAGGTCEVSAERISSSAQACSVVAAQELAGYRPVRLLPNFTVYANAAQARSTVSLIDTLPGCLIIRRYVEFGWKDAPGAAR